MTTLIEASLLGPEIKRLRQAAGLTQKELSGEFITVRTLQKIESGEITPSFEVLFHIANLLKIDMFDLILSSRIPFYIENQLDGLLAMLNRNQALIKSNELQQIENILTSFSQIKLSYNDKLKINIIYALFNTFFVAYREDTKLILKEHLSHFDYTNQQSNDLDLFAISGYLSLETDEQLLKEFISEISEHEQLCYFPAVTYALNRLYLKKADYLATYQLALKALGHIDMNKSIALIPYIYGQAAVASKHMNYLDYLKLAEAGLSLLKLLQKPDDFKVLNAWLKQNQIIVSLSD